MSEFLGDPQGEQFKVKVTMEAPDWALDGGFPEDLPFTDAHEVPEDAACVADYVPDAESGEVCAIYVSGGRNYKVKIS